MVNIGQTASAFRHLRISRENSCRVGRCNQKYPGAAERQLPNEMFGVIVVLFLMAALLDDGSEDAASDALTSEFGEKPSALSQ